MKKALSLAILVGMLFASTCWAGDAFRKWDRHSAEADRSLSRDFDGDGIPNAVDPFPNDRYKSDYQKDYDHDGISNPNDGYDNEWYKP